MVEVGRFDTRADAEFARSLLVTARIPCVLAPDEAAGVHPVDPLGSVRVLVAEADAHDAAVILGRRVAEVDGDQGPDVGHSGRRRSDDSHQARSPHGGPDPDAARIQIYPDQSPGR
jgi:hypothetical protein